MLNNAQVYDTIRNKNVFLVKSLPFFICLLSIVFSLIIHQFIDISKNYVRYKKGPIGPNIEAIKEEIKQP